MLVIGRAARLIGLAVIGRLGGVGLAGLVGLAMLVGGLALIGAGARLAFAGEVLMLHAGLDAIGLCMSLVCVIVAGMAFVSVVLALAAFDLGGNGLVGRRLLGASVTITPAPAIAAAALFATLLVALFLAVGARFLGDQRLPVGDRDLVIVRMDFREGQEAVAVAAIFDEGGLKGRFDPCHLRQIDIAPQWFAAGRFEIKFLDAGSANHHDPGLLRVGGVDEHLVGH